MGNSSIACMLALLIAGVCKADTGANTYYGRLIGSLESQYHGIRGDVYAVDARTLFIKGFSYDGKGQDALFYAGSSSRVGTDGFVIPNEDGSTESLSRAYEDQDLTLTLPEGKTIKEIRWLTVWSRSFSEAFGEVKVPAGFDYPRPQRLTPLSGIHQVASDRIYVVDAQTFLLPNFTYDGQAPDAFFWVGTGPKPNQEGAQVPDENGKTEPLRRYDTKTLVLTLPGDLTVFDVEWLSVWCKAYGIDFGHIRIPKNLNVPPSLKMLGVAPQAKLNCEVLWDDLALEVRWAVAGETIVLQLVGKIDDGQYVAFGPSGDSKRTRMIGADVAVGWLDRESGKGFVHDHYMTSKSACTAGKGVCQDTQSARGTNNIRLLNAALVNDYVMLTYQRPLKAQDEQDKSIITNGTQAVIWAVGPLSSDNEPTYHKLRNKGDLLIDFGRSPFWNCPAPEDPTATSGSVTVPSVQRRPTTEENRWSSLDGNSVGPNTQLLAKYQPPQPPQPPSQPSPPAVSNKLPWYIPAIECNEPENHVYYAHLGPNGGSQGYNAITGNLGWGVSWFINGLLIPEVTVVRGETYTFVVEGGQDPDRPSRYHPFYITDDPEGGYEFKTPDERSKIRIFAGVTYDRDGNPVSSAQGRLCEWVEDPSQPADKFTSFGAYQRTLKLHCEEGEPAIMQFKPDVNTPDTIYYQSYVHRYLGWKIRVVDSCDLDHNNRKAGTSGQPSNEFNPASKRPLEDDQREYPDYYEDDVPRIPEIKKIDNAEPSNTMDFAPEYRAPESEFFPENAFGGNFPSEFEDFFRESSFGSRDEDRPVPQRTTAPPPRPSPTTRPTVPQRYYSTPVPTAPPTLPPTLPPVKPTKPAPAVVRTTEPPLRIAPQVVVKTEEQKPHISIPIPGPVKQLTKLIQHSSNFRQRPNLQNHQREPLPNQEPAEPRPLIPDRQQDRSAQSERPAWSPPSNEQQNNNFNAKDVIPTRINPPPVQAYSFNPQAGGVFNPNTIILESGFKPIRNVDGPIPPLGFDVEPQNLEGKGITAEDPRVTSESPSLVTLDPVFVASEQDHRRPKEPVPITLPKAVVPVVPGPSMPAPRFPPQHDANQQVNPPNPQQFKPHPKPPALPAQRPQPRPPQFSGQDANARPHSPPGPPPARKKSSGLAAFFNFGGNRRKEQNVPPLATPIAVGSSTLNRPSFNWQPQNGPVLQRNPVPVQAGWNREQNREQQSSHQQPQQGPHQGAHFQRPFPSDEQSRAGEQPLSLQQRQQQEDKLRNRNNPAQNRPSSQPHSKPSQGLTGLLQRFLGNGGDRRKDGTRQQFDSKSDVAHAVHKAPPPVAINGKADSPFPPEVSFQGSLPPIIVSKVQTATRPNFDGVRRSERPLNKKLHVLDPFSASIIGGGSVLGTAGKPVISDAERAQLERFLFGPSEQYTPRSFSSESLLSNFEDWLSGEAPSETLLSKIAEVLSREATTDTTAEEDSTTEPDLSTASSTAEDGDLASVDEKPHNVLSDDEADHEGVKQVGSESERRKRQIDDSDHRNDNQHLDQLPQELDSSQLPVEHRGLDDEDVQDAHQQNEKNGSTTFVPWFSLSSALLLFVGFTRFHLNHF